MSVINKITLFFHFLEYYSSVKKIRIGIDARMFSDNFTGIGRYTFELTKRLFEKKSADFLIEWVLFLNEPEFSQFEFPKNVKKVCVDAKHYSLAEQTKFLQILNREKCDLVHFTHFNVPLFYRRPYVVTVHDTTLSFYPGAGTSFLKQLVYKIVIGNAIHSAKKIITVSKNTAKDVRKLFAPRRDKLIPIWNGLTDDFQPVSMAKQKKIREKFKLSDSFLLYTGVWREHKNIAGLFRAFAELRSKKSADFSDVDLVLTGNPLPELLTLAQDLGIQKNIKALGKVPFDDLVGLMSAAKLFVFPSFYEGFGLPPLEAMKAETPVIVSNTSAMPEVCGEAAEYFDPNNLENMIEKIGGFFVDTKKQKSCVAAGKKQAAQFSWDTCADETWSVYTMLLKK